MKEADFQEKLNSIQEKIGEDASNLILDEIGVLLTDNKSMNNLIDDKESRCYVMNESIRLEDPKKRRRRDDCNC